MYRVLACILCLLPVRLADAQTPQPTRLPRGALIRFEPPGNAPVTGRLLEPFASGDSTIAFCEYHRPWCPGPDSSNVRVAGVRQLRHLTVSRGSATWSGALVGGTAAAAFLVIGRVAWNDPDARIHMDARWMAGAVSFVGAGALVGGLVGSRHRRWAPVATDPM